MEYFSILHFSIQLGSGTPSLNSKSSSGWPRAFPSRAYGPCDAASRSPGGWNQWVLLKELGGNSSVLLTQVSGSMNRYSLERFARRQIPGNTNPVSPERDWTAIVPDEPYRAKGLCRWNLYSTTTSHIRPLSPLHSSPLASTIFHTQRSDSQNLPRSPTPASQAWLPLQWLIDFAHRPAKF